MNKNSLKKVMSALAVAAVAASATSVVASAAQYPDGDKTDLTNYGTSADAKTNPVLTINVEGKGNEVVYDKASDIAGKTITCTLDVSGANLKYASTGLHVFFDSRYELVLNEKGKAATKGAAIEDIMPAAPKEDPTAPEGFKGFFVATAGEEDAGLDGTMWTFQLKVPEDAKKGDVFPIDIIYRNEGAEDLFINKAVDEDGCNMQASAFVKGIFNEDRAFGASAANVEKVAALANINTTMDAYVAIADEEPVETTATTATAAPSTTTTAASGATTSAKASSSTKASTTAAKDAPKTGVAGCGVAVAGLAVALGTAFVLRKKED